MQRWRLLLGGLLIWAAHFGAIYAIASISYVWAGETGLWARLAVVCVSALCVLACAWVFMAALREPKGEGLHAFWRTIAASGAVLAGIAILWQTLPVFAALEGTGPFSPS